MELDKEIIDEFNNECEVLFGELENTLEKLEDNGAQEHLLESFGQVIDRIMGAATTIELHEIAKFCELGKVIGYKSSQTIDNAQLTQVVIAVLFDTVDLLQKMVDSLKENGSTSLKSLNTEAFGERLKWLSAKFKDVERGSCKIDSESQKLNDQEDIDDLLDELGL